MRLDLAQPPQSGPEAEAAGLQPAPLRPLAHSDSRLFVGTSSLARRWQARAGSAQRRRALAAAGGSVRHLACNSPTLLSHPPHHPARRLTPSPSLKGIALRAIRHVGARLGFPPGFGGRSSTGLPACLHIPQCFALGRCRRPAPTPEARSFRFAELPRLQRRVAPVRRARPCRAKPGTHLASAVPGVVSVASAAARRLRLPPGRLHAGPPCTGVIEPVRLSAAGAACQSEAGRGRLSLPGSAGRCALPALLNVGPASGRYRGPPTPPIVTPMMTRILFFPSPHTLLSTPHNLLTLHHLIHHSLVLGYPTWSVH